MDKKISFEEIFLSFIGDGKKLQWELDNNINILDLADKKVLLAADVILAFIPESTKEGVFEYTDINSILDLLRKERPDIYKTLIEHPIGRVWVGDQIINFKRRFLDGGKNEN